MCDHDGFYTFANGTKYKGSFKTCSKLLKHKFGMFDGNGVVKIPGVGGFQGKFKKNLLNGPGRYELIGHPKQVDRTFYNCSIEELEVLLR